MPDRNPVSGLEILNERQLRLIGIGNYVAIYRVFDDEGIVEVYRVLYGKMDLERDSMKKNEEVFGRDSLPLLFNAFRP